MEIGLYFGSFNPIHHGHLMIANYAAQYHHLHEVWLVVSPQNPFKSAQHLLNENHRLHLARLATEGNHLLRVSNIEFKLPKPSYTVDTMVALQEKYPNHNFSILLGSDGFENLDRWKNVNYLKSHIRFLVYERPGFPIMEKNDLQYEIMKGPLLDISSTQIRKMIQERKSIQYLVPDVVAEEIKNQHFYAVS
jgi:nicotinate-nucleotide adenylyltransferase